MLDEAISPSLHGGNKGPPCPEHALLSLGHKENNSKAIPQLSFLSDYLLLDGSVNLLVHWKAGKSMGLLTTKMHEGCIPSVF